MEKKCNICEVVKSVEKFHTCGKYKDKQYYRGECIECSNNQRRGQNNDYSKEYNQRPEVKIRRKKYRQNLAKQENHMQHVRDHERNRYHTDVLYNFKKKLRSRLKSALKSKKWLKNNGLVQYLGCSIEELKKNFIIKFTEGMSWDKFLNGEIHIDHIIPLDSCKTEEEMYKLCHFSNLQPLWAKDNIMKSNKILF